MELTTLGSSNFTYIVLQSDFDLLSKCLTVPIELLINLPETLYYQSTLPLHQYIISILQVDWQFERDQCYQV